ncbi:MAG: hypothetical protein KDC95_02705 [Planctomycetes bacterium]|nr:hypothetical protein [Planctomycetota bacterium]
MTARASFLLLTLCGALLLGGASAQIPDFGGAGAEERVTLRSEVTPKTARPGEVVTVVHRATIAPGWHVYGRLEENGQPTSITISELGGLVAFGPPVLPIGEVHESYGMQSYYVEFEAELRQRFFVPFDAKPGDIELKGLVDYTACDANSCDPPAQTPFTVALTIEQGAARDEYARKKAEVLFVGIEKGTRRGESGAIVVQFDVMPGYHMYGSKETGGVATAVTVTNAEALASKGLKFGAAAVPAGDPNDANGFVTYDLHDQFEIRIPFTVAKDAKGGSFEPVIKIDYQVCDEKSCDLPTAIELKTAFPIEGGDAREDRLPAAGVGATGGSGSGNTASNGSQHDGSVADDDTQPAVKSSGSLADAGLWQLILLAIGGGLFALAMPCTYPMIPITISFFTKQADARGGKVLPLALLYGAGIVLMFVVIGAALGNVIVPFASHWITNLVIGVFFLVFALSLFGLINLQPPRFLMNATGKASTHGGALGVFLMGATLVISSFTCTAPFVGNILAVGAQGGVQSAMLGMGIFGLTMAVPFVGLALVPGAIASMPSSGQWMNTLKVFLGFVEVAAALKFLSNVELVLGLEALPREHFLFLWAGIFVIAAIFLLGMIRFKGESGEIGPGRLLGGLIVALLAMYFATGAFGNRLDWVMESIAPPYSKRMAWAGSDQEGGSGESKLAWTIVKDDFDGAKALAVEDDKLVFLNITGVT